MRTSEAEEVDDFGSTRTSVIESAQRHDSAGWTRLVELYGPLVFHWCRRSSLAQEDAADVVQEVFRSVAGRLKQFESSRGSGSFRGWDALRLLNRLTSSSLAATPSMRAAPSTAAVGNGFGAVPRTSNRSPVGAARGTAEAGGLPWPARRRGAIRRWTRLARKGRSPHTAMRWSLRLRLAEHVSQRIGEPGGFSPAWAGW